MWNYPLLALLFFIPLPLINLFSLSWVCKSVPDIRGRRNNVINAYAGGYIQALRGPSTTFTGEEAMHKTRQIQEGGENWCFLAGRVRKEKKITFTCTWRQRMFVILFLLLFFSSMWFNKTLNE